MKCDTNSNISWQMFEFYERVSGARMHAAYVRPGGVHQVSIFSTFTGDQTEEMSGMLI